MIQEEYQIKLPYPRKRDDERLARIASQIMADISRGAKKEQIEYFI
ncbi:MAG: hypothetical protein IJ747_02050 [Lachnospiraceae bacterium]|nr:hypothetical protein [Lachnospiraceae bacterium]